MIQTLPENAQKIIDQYFHLKLDGKEVACPYFINLKRKKDLRAMMGKGTPEEIEMEAKIWEKVKGVEFENMNESEIRKFLMERGIGIDCSGFVVHVLNNWYKAETGKSIWPKMKIYNKSIAYRIAYFLKPVEKLGAEIITGELNADKIEISDVKPGDLIRSKWSRPNAHHVMMISKVDRDDSGKVTELEYVNSTEQYGDANGVRYGKIRIKDEFKPLQDQEWLDYDENGINPAYEGFLYEVEDNGLRRVRAIKNLQ